ncbi:MAG: RnfABCDGE type electron transport complex subunit G [Clostridia bacterium]|nr:RnfABCDGE type electron transport complex subunit G [Clostridia bacterium]
MNEISKLGGKLLVIAAVAGLALGLTNAMTEGPIAQQRIQEANTARACVLPAAEGGFEELDNTNAELDEIYKGLTSGGETAGYTGKITVRGYGGPIEVTVGVDMSGTITGISVGGSDFSETAGLGAKTKDAAFTDQFAGLSAEDLPGIAVKADGGVIDAVSSATISSRAVSKGVRTVCEALTELIKEG